MNELITAQDERLARAIDAALTGLAQTTQTVYRARLLLFFSRPHKSGFTRESVQSYLRTLKEPSVINQSLSALKRLATEAAESGWLPWPEAIAISRIKGKRTIGVRTGRWLTLAQVQAIMKMPDKFKLPGKRDAAMLALLFGCGLRRAEACALTYSHYLPVAREARDDGASQQPARLDKPSAERVGGARLSNVIGKGARPRTITVPTWAAQKLDDWLASSGISSGPILRSFHTDGTMNDSLTADGVYKILAHYARQLGVKCAPHDARRSMARLSRNGGASLECVQKTLGHSNQSTTEKYIQTTEAADAGDYIKI